MLNSTMQRQDGFCPASFFLSSSLSAIFFYICLFVCVSAGSAIRLTSVVQQHQ
jgi:hypothetical protein